MGVEYKVYRPSFGIARAGLRSKLERLLNTEARDGWRLRQMLPPTWGGIGLIVVMERPVHLRSESVGPATPGTEAGR
ncbi:MAG: DUF4177 domain-containing protein [Acidobacteriota bacterium]